MASSSARNKDPIVEYGSIKQPPREVPWKKRIGFGLYVGIVACLILADIYALHQIGLQPMAMVTQVMGICILFYVVGSILGYGKGGLVYSLLFLSIPLLIAYTIAIEEVSRLFVHYSVLFWALSLMTVYSDKVKKWEASLSLIVGEII